MFYGFDHFAPMLVVLVASSKYNPVLATIRDILAFLNRPLPILSFPLLIIYRIFIGFCLILGALPTLSVFSIGILITAYGIGSLYLSTLHIIPRGYGRCGQNVFNDRVQIYKNLRIMANLQSEIAADLITTRMHHTYVILLSTISLYYILFELSAAVIHLNVVVLCCMVLFFTFIVEYVGVCFVAKASLASKQFIRKMQIAAGSDKLKRRIVKTLLPNFINVEVVTSVAGLENGIEPKYFLNYLDRVVVMTIDLWLSSKKV